MTKMRLIAQNDLQLALHAQNGTEDLPTEAGMKLLEDQNGLGWDSWESQERLVQLI